MENTLMLKARGQKILKAIHIICTAFVIGGLLSMLVLTMLKQHGKVGDNPFLIDWSIYQINNVVTYSFLGIVLTAFVYALFTKWGFFKHHWITVKWAGLVILFVLFWFWIGPAINGTVGLSDGGLHLTTARDEYLDYSAKSRLFIIIMGLIILFLCFISTYKPWGTRKKEYRVNRKVIIIVVGLLVVAGVVNSVLSSMRLRKYRTMEIADSALSTLEDGTYPGEATFGFTYKVEVTVQDHKMTNITVVQNCRSPYARFAEGVIPKILKAQNANVDAVTGATTTSKCLMKAIEKALTKEK